MHSVLDEAFQAYGTVIQGYDFTDLMQRMEHTLIPEKGNVYVASDKQLELSLLKIELQSNFFGGMPIQIGYCNGRNDSLNGLEYHKCSEINLAVTELILLLGHVRHIRKNRYSSEQVEAFYVPKGTAVEIYQTTLHFGPCKVSSDGFRCAVVLPKGTNEPLTERLEPRTEEDQRLFMKNKWLLVHPENRSFVQRGAIPGITGPNIQVNSLKW